MYEKIKAYKEKRREGKSKTLGTQKGRRGHKKDEGPKKRQA